MSAYPTSDSDIRVPAGELHARVEAIFLRRGLSRADANLLTDSLVTADLRGIHSHGVLRVPDYVHKLTHGVDPFARPRIARDSAAVFTVDAANAMGQIACHFAMRQAIDRARGYGISAAAIHGSNHAGALFHTAIQALPEGMIGIATTNALPTMAPWGGRDKILGINPLAMAVPSAEEPPLVFDAAFSASSHGKIRVYHQKGAPLPDGWALDPEGNPTTDPAQALHGLLRPIGEYKGAGLAILMGVLSSFLSGAAFGTELGDMVSGPRPGQDGQFVLALNIAAFEDPAVFRSRVDALIRQIRSSAPAPGHERCYAPGELEHLTELSYRRDGIPLNPETLAGIAACEAGRQD